MVIISTGHRLTKKTSLPVEYCQKLHKTLNRVMPNVLAIAVPPLKYNVNPVSTNYCDNNRKPLKTSIVVILIITQICFNASHVKAAASWFSAII